MPTCYQVPEWFVQKQLVALVLSIHRVSHPPAARHPAPSCPAYLCRFCRFIPCCSGPPTPAPILPSVLVRRAGSHPKALAYAAPLPGAPSVHSAWPEPCQLCPPHTNIHSSARWPRQLRSHFLCDTLPQGDGLVGRRSQPGISQYLVTHGAMPPLFWQHDTAGCSSHVLEVCGMGLTPTHPRTMVAACEMESNSEGMEPTVFKSIGLSASQAYEGPIGEGVPNPKTGTLRLHVHWGGHPGADRAGQRVPRCIRAFAGGAIAHCVTMSFF